MCLFVTWTLHRALAPEFPTKAPRAPIALIAPGSLTYPSHCTPCPCAWEPHSSSGQDSWSDLLWVMLSCGWSWLMWSTCLTLLVNSPGNALALLSPSARACLPWWAAPQLQPRVTPCIQATEDIHCFYHSQISSLLRLPQRQIQITKYWENTGKSLLVQTLPN